MRNDPQADDAPRPSAELAMIRVLAEAYLQTIPRKRAIRTLRLVADRLSALAATDANVLPFRPPEDREAVMVARRQALAWFREILPTWMAALDE